MTEIQILKQRFSELCDVKSLDYLQKSIENLHLAAKSLINKVTQREKDLAEVKAASSKFSSEVKDLKQKLSSTSQNIEAYEQGLRQLNELLTTLNSDKSSLLESNQNITSEYEKLCGHSKKELLKKMFSIEWLSWKESEDTPIIYVEAKFTDAKSDNEAFQLPITKLDALKDPSVAIKVIENIDWVWAEIEKSEGL